MRIPMFISGVIDIDSSDDEELPPVPSTSKQAEPARASSTPPEPSINSQPKISDSMKKRKNAEEHASRKGKGKGVSPDSDIEVIEVKKESAGARRKSRSGPSGDGEVIDLSMDSSPDPSPRYPASQAIMNPSTDSDEDAYFNTPPKPEPNRKARPSAAHQTEDEKQALHQRLFPYRAYAGNANSEPSTSASTSASPPPPRVASAMENIDFQVQEPAIERSPSVEYYREDEDMPDNLQPIPAHLPQAAALRDAIDGVENLQIVQDSEDERDPPSPAASCSPDAGVGQPQRTPPSGLRQDSDPPSDDTVVPDSRPSSRSSRRPSPVKAFSRTSLTPQVASKYSTPLPFFGCGTETTQQSQNEGTDRAGGRAVLEEEGEEDDTESSRNLGSPGTIMEMELDDEASLNTRAPKSEPRRRPAGYRHRQAILWTGKEVEGEFDGMMVDLVNSSHPTSLKEEAKRMLFESMMNEQICREEPASPRVHIIDADSDSSYPPFEYIYTNRLIYRKGVGAPSQATGCDCRDGCNPNIRECSCFKRQSKWNALWDQPPSFAYDKDGRLCIDTEIPIWECNSECSCPADCSNRQVSNGRKVPLDIVKTEKKGWGIQNAEDGTTIRKGTFLCIYAGEVLTWRYAEGRGRLNDKMPNPRSYLFNIDSKFIQSLEGPQEFERSGIMVIEDNVPAKMIQGSNIAEDKTVEASDEAKQTRPTYTVDAMHYGNLSRYFNHSCNPNAEINSVFVDDQDVTKPILVIFAKKKIRPGEEVTISYRGYIEGASSNESESSDDATPKPQQKGKGRRKKQRKQGGKLSKGAAADDEEFGVIDAVCYCESSNCDGRIFNRDDITEDVEVKRRQESDSEA